MFVDILLCDVVLNHVENNDIYLSYNFQQIVLQYNVVNTCI